MAIAFVGGAILGKQGATSGNNVISLSSGLTGGTRSAVQAGDYVIAVYAQGEGISRTLAITDGTADYPLLFAQLYQSGVGGYNSNLRAGAKFMGSTPDAGVTFGPTGSSAAGGVTAVMVFSGVNAATPLDVAAITASGDGMPNPSAITPVTAGALIVSGGAVAMTGATGTLLSSPDLANFIAALGNDTIDAHLGIGTHAWSTGAFDPAVFGGATGAGEPTTWTAFTLALRPNTVDIVPASGSHAHAASSSAITTPIAPDSADHGHTASSPTVSSSTLSPADGVHGSTSTSPTIAARSTITPASAAHAHAATTPSITPRWSLSVASAVHAHVAGSPTIARSVITPASRRFAPPASRAVGRRFTPSASRVSGRRFTPEG